MSKKIFPLLVLLSWGFLASASDQFSFGIEVEAWRTEAGLENDTVRTANGSTGTFNYTYPDTKVIPSIGLIGQYKSWFVKLTRSLETEFPGNLQAMTVNEVPNPLIQGTDRSTLTVDFSTPMERVDTDISIGYSWSSGFSIFGGYKSIEFDEFYSAQNIQFLVETFDSGGTLFDSVIFPVSNFVWTIDNTYEYSGPFLGLAYNKIIGNTPFSFEASVAYTDLGGDWDQSQTISTDFTPDGLGGLIAGNPQATTTRSDVDADGVSIKAGISYSINAHLSAGLSYKRQDYNENTDSVQAPDLKSDGIQLRIRFMF